MRVNKGWESKISGGRNDAIVGKTDFDFFSPEHAPRHLMMNERHPDRNAGHRDRGEGDFPDRPDRWVSTTKMPFRNKAGEIIGTFGISRDITEIKQYRDDLQKAKDELEERVKARTAELSKAKLALEQNLERLKFLNVTAYELVQSMDLDLLFKLIGTAFLARIPDAQISICQKTRDGFSCVLAKGHLDTPEGRKVSEAALSRS